MKKSLNNAFKDIYTPFTLVSGNPELELRQTIEFLVEENKKLKIHNHKLEREKETPQKALHEAIDLMVKQNEELLEKKEELANQNKELERSEKELKKVLKINSESEAKYKSIVDGFVGFVGLLRKDFQLSYTNDNYLDLLMIENKDTNKCYELIYGINEPCLDCPMKSVLNSQKSLIKEIFIERTQRWYKVIFSPVKNNSKTDSIVLMISDITQRKLLEKQLENERDKLEKAVEKRTQALNFSLQKIQATNISLQEVNIKKDKFFSSMSHELRTPLNAILGFTKLLEEQYFGVLNNHQLEYINYISTSGEHLLALINDLLDVAKINSGKFNLQKSPFDPINAIEKVISLMQNQFKEKDISLNASYHQISDWINADERKFNQILFNLLSNALKFTPQGGKVFLEAFIYEQNWLKVIVKDTGIGIKEEFINEIFTDFYQLDYTQKELPGGTGIGLTISKHLVELHNGKIGVESEYKKGSSFWFMLPLK